MSGIREPKKNDGPTGTGLVGDQRYPKTNGREHHAVFIPPLMAAGAGIARLAPLAMRGARAVRNIFARPTPFQGPTGTVVPGRTVVSPAKNVRILSSGSYSGVKFTKTPSTVTGSGAPITQTGLVPTGVGSSEGS
jgi:hypothetical protein